MNQIGQGIIYILGAKVAVVILALLNAILIPRILGPQSMGFYTYWLSVYFILGTILSFGGSSIILRYIPEFRKKNPESIRPLLKRMLWIKIPIVILIFFASQFVKEQAYFLLILLSAAIFSLGLMVRDILYAYKHMGKYSFLQPSNMLSKLIIILIFFSFWQNPGILLAIILNSTLITLIFGLSAFKLLPKTSGALNRPFKEILGFGLFIYLGGLLSTLTNWLLPVISKRYIGDLAAIGYIGLGIQVYLLIINFVSSVGEGVLPSLIEFYTEADERFTRSIQLTWRYTNLILLPVVFGIFILIEPAIITLVGEKFLPGARIIKLLLPGAIFVCWVRVHQQILFSFKKKGQMFFVQLIKFVTFLGASLYLIKNYGLVGAPVSLSLAALVGFVLSLFFSWKLKPIPKYLSSILKPLVASCGMGLLIRSFSVANLLSLAGAILSGMVIYLIIMVAIRGITKEDVKRVVGSICKRVGKE